MKWMSAGAVTGMLPIALGSYSTGWISVEHHELRLPKWDADGFKVALIADLHTNSPDAAAYASNAIRLVLEEKPDLIAIPGDFVNLSDDKHIEFLRQGLEPLHDHRLVLGADRALDELARSVPDRVLECLGHDVILVIPGRRAG